MGDTQPEVAITRKQIKYRGIKAMPFVIGNETFEKLGTIGTSANLLVYLTTIFHLDTITATNIINIFNGTCNFGTVIGAFFSDTYFGRYNTLGFASVSSFLGMLVMTLTAAITTLHPPPCKDSSATLCNGPTAWQMTFLLSGFGLLVIGASGIRPCNLAFGADQFDPNTESGRRGIGSFFNWYYFTYTFAVMVSLTAIVYVQSNVSWSLGLAIPTILMFMSCALFFAGTKIYVRVFPEGSPLKSVVQVLVAAFKKRKLDLPEHPLSLFHHHAPSNSLNSRLSFTNQFRCLSKAAIRRPEEAIKEDGSAENPWELCSVQQVEEVKCLVRILPIWGAGMIYYISVVQAQNFLVFQALQSDRHLGNHRSFQIPPTTFIVFAMLSITLWLPLYDRIILPILRKHTKKEDGITLLQKMGIGMFLSVISMVASALVETRRRRSLGSSMSALWLIPQMALSGLSEAFALIGENEFFYRECPENMRSIAGSLFFVGLAGASYLSSLLTSVVNRTTEWLGQDLNQGRLDYFYYIVAALEIINLIYFLVCAKWYKYKGNTTHQKPPV